MLVLKLRVGNLLEEFLVAGESKWWTVYGIAPARDAFHQANWNEFVRQRIGGLTLANLKRPRIRFLGMVPENSLRLPMRQAESIFSLYDVSAYRTSCEVHRLQRNSSSLPSSTFQDGRAFRIAFMEEQLPGV